MVIFNVNILELVGLIIGLVLLFIFIICTIIESILNLFKQNCYKCKHYKLYNTFSAGQYCQYKCHKLNRIDVQDMNEHCNYIWCKYYEEENKNEH